jgi:hypothetical protein
VVVCVLVTFLVPQLIQTRPPRIDLNRFGLVVVISLLLSRISAVKRRTEHTLRQAAEELEDRVRERTVELLSTKWFCGSKLSYWTSQPTPLCRWTFGR